MNELTEKRIAELASFLSEADFILLDTFRADIIALMKQPVSLVQAIVADEPSEELEKATHELHDSVTIVDIDLTTYKEE